MQILHIQTQSRSQLFDITKQIQQLVTNQRWQSGILTIFSPHTTGGITLNENWDPDVQHDMILKLDESFPDDPRFRHGEGNSDSHIKTTLCGSSQTVIIEDGKMQLGQWQGIYFAEWDGLRSRKVYVQFVGA